MCILHDWTCEYKQKFPAYMKERRREEGLRESIKAKAMYVQNKVTLNFFYSYCNKTRDLGGADAAMWYMMAMMLLSSAREAYMNPQHHLSLLASCPQAEAGDSPGSIVSEPRSSCHGLATSHHAGEDHGRMRHTALVALLSLPSLSPGAPATAMAPGSGGCKDAWAHQLTWSPSIPLGQDGHSLPALAMAPAPIS